MLDFEDVKMSYDEKSRFNAIQKLGRTVAAWVSTMMVIGEIALCAVYRAPWPVGHWVYSVFIVIGNVVVLSGVFLAQWHAISLMFNIYAISSVGTSYMDTLSTHNQYLSERYEKLERELYAANGELRRVKEAGFRFDPKTHHQNGSKRDFVKGKDVVP